MDRQSGSIQTKAKGASGEKTIAAVRQVDETRGKRKTSEKEESSNKRDQGKERRQLVCATASKSSLYVGLPS